MLRFCLLRTSVEFLHCPMVIDLSPERPDRAATGVCRFVLAWARRHLDGSTLRFWDRARQAPYTSRLDERGCCCLPAQLSSNHGARKILLADRSSWPKTTRLLPVASSLAFILYEASCSSASESAMIQILGVNPEVLPVLPHVLLLLIPPQRLAHIECVFPTLSSRWVIDVVVDHAPEDGVSVMRFSVSILIHPLAPSIPPAIPVYSSTVESREK